MNSTSQKLAYCLSKEPLSPKIRNAISRIKEAYEADDRIWIVGYSGGKDSSATLKLLFHAIRISNFHHKPVQVVYCNTGVEIPIAAKLAKTVLHEFNKECQALRLPITTIELRPRLRDRFFVKILGRGYPPPTDKFRWCTERLRINPVSDYLKKATATSAVVVLGVREGESATRNLTLKENKGTDRFWKKQKGYNDRELFMPIIDFSTTDVWHTLLNIKNPTTVHGAKVADLYAAAAGECPAIRDPVSPPCGSARFGCWTCTVAKKSETLNNFADSGLSTYRPLQEYRAWLSSSRNEARYRWKNRRNGSPGPGPMTMKWRQMALAKLLKIEKEIGEELIPHEELTEIKKYWSNE